MADENTTQVQEQDMQATPIKRGRGRPIGSRNKPKAILEQAKTQEAEGAAPTIQSVG